MVIITQKSLIKHLNTVKIKGLNQHQSQVTCDRVIKVFTVVIKTHCRDQNEPKWFKFHQTCCKNQPLWLRKWFSISLFIRQHFQRITLIWKSFIQWPHQNKDFLDNVPSVRPGLISFFFLFFFSNHASLLRLSVFSEWCINFVEGWRGYCKRARRALFVSAVGGECKVKITFTSTELTESNSGGRGCGFRSPPGSPPSRPRNTVFLSKCFAIYNCWICWETGSFASFVFFCV